MLVAVDHQSNQQEIPTLSCLATAILYASLLLHALVTERFSFSQLVMVPGRRSGYTARITATITKDWRQFTRQADLPPGTA